MVAFELAVQDPSGIAAAVRVRPDRIELCTALANGGVTPSGALIAAAVAAGVPTHVLIRVREGGFVYDSAELDVMVDDARRAVDAGAAGVVVGALVDGQPDPVFLERVRRAVPDVEVTFHRAFDVIDDRMLAIETLIDAGVDRVLTSGGASRAIDAHAELRAIVDHAAGRVQIMAGAGVLADDVAALAATGVDALHASAKRVVFDAMPVSLGSDAAAGVIERATVDLEVATRLQTAIGAIGVRG